MIKRVLGCFWVAATLQWYNFDHDFFFSFLEWSILLLTNSIFLLKIINN